MKKLVTFIQTVGHYCTRPLPPPPQSGLVFHAPVQQSYTIAISIFNFAKNVLNSGVLSAENEHT